jgi:hypothetical protein
MIVHDMPEHIRSDNGPKFIANRLCDWLAKFGLRQPTSNEAVPERMVIARVSTEHYEMNCSADGYFTKSRKLRLQ